MQKTDSFWSKCFKNKEGRIVLWQNPNILLWTWLASEIATNLLMYGVPHRLFDTLAFGTLFTWAYIEIRSGVNYFRRILGALVLLFIVSSRIL